MLIDDSKKKKLEEFSELLLKWNKKINLIAKSTEDKIWERHILDSASLKKYITDNNKIIDLGSGAGFPGIVLAILGIKEITLIESYERKCVFLRLASKLSSSRAEILNIRAEDYLKSEKEIDIITSRAMCSIDQLLAYYEIIQPKKSMLILKGPNYQKELDEAAKNWHFNYNIYPGIDSHSYIIEIKNVTKKT